MKTFYGLLFGVTLISLYSCKADIRNQDAELTNQVIASDIKPNEPGIISPEDKIYTMLHDMDNHTWQDLDTYYRLETQDPNEALSNNLKKITIIYLVNHFGLLEKADIPTIEFYFSEQQKMGLVEPAVFVKTLKRLYGVWPNQNLKNAAQQKLDSALSYINSSLKDPQSYLEQHKEGFEQWKDFIGQIPAEN